MTHSIISESFIFLSMILCGMTSGVIYAFLRGLRRVVKKKFFALLSDVIFAAVTLIILFFALEKTCGGNIRFYQIAGFIAGFCIVELFFALITQRRQP